MPWHRSPPCLTPERLSAQVDGKSLILDFSPKGGPKDVVAAIGFSPKTGAQILTFPDGNVWTKI